MEEYEKTVGAPMVDLAALKNANRKNMLITIFDGNNPPVTYRLSDFKKASVSFGRDKANDIVLTSRLVSGEHGRLSFNGVNWFIEDKAAYRGVPSTNGLIFNNRMIIHKVINEGDLVRIDDGVEAVADGVLFTFSLENASSRWAQLPVGGRKRIVIGRDATCDISLQHVSISKQHAFIDELNGKYYIMDNHSTNGVLVNGTRISGKVLLHEKDVIAISNAKLIFTSQVISYVNIKSGISVDAHNVVITRKQGGKSFVTGNNVSMSINPGELVAIIGGSGAGKSTILNAMCGYLPPASGEVYINGVDLYKNSEYFKRIYGYVPQQDIVYDNLTLHDMLKYTAKLRLPKDSSNAEIEAAIDRVIDIVELKEKKNAYIKALSGGQKKRASIAVELLPDPNLIFLDEPASGLDPGTERNLMQSLRKMADSGKTVILVTHSTLQLKLCDKIAFMGKGGNLCFLGTHDEALRFFGVNDIVDVYNMITEHPLDWRKKYDELYGQSNNASRNVASVPQSKGQTSNQLGVLCARYFKLVLNDRTRFMLLLGMPLIMALIVGLVANGDQYKMPTHTQSLYFCLACCASFLGILFSIQEVCKERVILMREYKTGLSMKSYILSKIIVLGILNIIQSLIIVGVFGAIAGLPEEGVITTPFLEIFITTALTTIASTGMGLLVSTFFKNPDRAMTVSPFLLLPQIIFSEVVFTLTGVMKSASALVICRWTMEGYGSTSDINGLYEGLGKFDLVSDTMERTASHMWTVWSVLAVFIVVLTILSRVMLSKMKKETN